MNVIRCLILHFVKLVQMNYPKHNKKGRGNPLFYDFRNGNEISCRGRVTKIPLEKLKAKIKNKLKEEKNAWNLKASRSKIFWNK